MSLTPRHAVFAIFRASGAATRHRQDALRAREDGLPESEIRRHEEAAERRTRQVQAFREELASMLVAEEAAG